MVKLSWVGGGRHASGHAGAAAGDRSVGLRQRQGVPRPRAGRAGRRRARRSSSSGPGRSAAPCGRCGAARWRPSRSASRRPAPASLAFAISGFIAGLGGALLAMQQENVNYGNNFSPFAAPVLAGARRDARRPHGRGRRHRRRRAFALFDTVILKGTFLGWILRSPDRIPGHLPALAEVAVHPVRPGRHPVRPPPRGPRSRRSKRRSAVGPRRRAAAPCRTAGARRRARRREAEPVQAGEPVAMSDRPAARGT